ncbi:transglycosylase SLT domain-containing protein [Wenzhouxiangella marina]|uniref:Uncharacterized protein n=1 Tax=Wenzhouxiangella marina TaxID=1579979 RepID=A0A0K0XWV5_9GAMM|nr:hypothetical protein [Wenzhouxiangella marina]AKS42101.1 hypothetical protein WM2015_1732 [Wenzhouxiangella marina]MBB6086129.1 hypothetical protein [Wenzhouxiangella marina]
MSKAPDNTRSLGPARRVLAALAALAALAVLGLLSACATTPPANQDNLCEIFEEYPEWYDDARRSERRWGTPIAIQMAFVRQESAFRAGAKPERRRFLGIFPGRRPSSAEGYAQAQDPAWADYRRATGRRFASRGDMEDALDFIGWYNDVSHRRLGLARNNAYDLYLAYHEGHGGYSRRSWADKPRLRQIASRVDELSLRYQRQLASCEDALRCRRWYQFWPFCR